MTDFGIFQREIFGIEILGAYNGFVNPPAPYDCEDRAKMYDRLFYIVHGTIVIHIPGGRRLEAGAGTIVYLPNNCRYHSHWNTAAKGEYYSINFVLHDRAGQKRSVGENIEMIIKDRNRKYSVIFKRLFDTWVGGSIGSSLACNTLFWEIIQNLYIDIELGSMKLEYASIYPGILYLQNNYQTDTTAEELARMCSMSLSAFRREFKRRTGMSPVKYKNQLRIDKAKMLLESGEYSVTEACHYVGCPDVYYFNKLFKRCFGDNPSKFIPKDK